MDHIAASADRGVPSGVGAQIGLNEAHAGGTGRRVPADLAGNLIALTDAANAAANRIALGQQLPGNMAAEKAADSGYQNGDVAIFRRT